MAILVITMVNVQCCHCRASITKILESHKGTFTMQEVGKKVQPSFYSGSREYKYGEWLYNLFKSNFLQNND
jgi:hypothetical protein